MRRLTLLFLLSSSLAQATESGLAKKLGVPASSPSLPAGAPPARESPRESVAPESEQVFRAKLVDSLQKAEQSIKVIRKQIIESQNAPFIADLYVQLGDLLSQKAITLYYIKMENDSGVEGGTTKLEEAQPVVVATREAIEVYQTLLKDFPAYSKKADVTYKLAVCYKSIDDVPRFIGTTAKLIKDYPGTDYALRGSLLLGRHFLDEHEYDEALKLITPITESKLVYEKNLAKHWLGLIYLGKEKYADALKQFEAVINDPELKEQENPYDLKKAAGKGKTDLKREALLDSILAYTNVYDKNPDPVSYYQKLAPTEAYFQEVMEKLALRYVSIKKYDQSVKLLRTTSERTADAQKVINIYREVLLLMPIEQRIAISVDELSFVLHKFNLWQSYFNVPAKVHSDSYWYFEKQIRDIATRNHDQAKVEKDAAKKLAYLKQAKDYYHLYLPFFDRTGSTVKLATNLADVEYLLGNFLASGDLYLRIFQGEFGVSPNRKALLENSILALQRDQSTDFYEKVRAKGLLLKAITTLQSSSKIAKADPKLELLKLKTEYEQGFLPKAIDDLFAFAKTHPTTKQAVDAGDIITDYYNTLNDFSGLQTWSAKLLSLKLPDPVFNAKLKTIASQAKAKIVQEKVKSIKGYDEFSQGKSYLAAALQSNDVGLKDAAIQQALAKSKREHDLKTFLDAATALGKNEKNPQKRASLYRSVAQENLKVGNFYSGIAELRRAAADPALDPVTRRNLWDDSVSAALMLHDPSSLRQSMSDPGFAQVSARLKTQVRDALVDALDSPVELSAGDIDGLLAASQSEEVWLGAFKARNKTTPAQRALAIKQAQARCGSAGNSPLCGWFKFASLEPVRARVISQLRKASLDLKSIEGTAAPFMEASRAYQALEGSSDSHLETALSLRGREIYLEFAGYLSRVANANPSLKADLMQKANESSGSAAIYLQKCKTLAAKAQNLNPAMRYCSASTYPSLDALLTWPTQGARAARSDVKDSNVESLQKSVFSSDTEADPLLRLAVAHLQAGRFYHAAAVSLNGISSFKAREGEFKTILACGLIKLGYLNEANFHAKSAVDYQNLLPACLASLQKVRGL